MSTQMKVLAVWALLVFGANLVPSESEALSITPLPTPVELKVDLKQKQRVTKHESCYANVQCRKLAEAVFFEGRGESVKGQYAIAYTIINRRDSGKFPDDIRAVVDQKRRGICQFSYMCQFNVRERAAAISNDNQSWMTALTVAYNTFHYEAADPTRGADHFHTKQVKPVWRHSLQPALALGNHIFYRS